MLAMAVITAGICVLTLVAGLAVRSRLVRCPVAPPAGAVPPAGIHSPLRWRRLAGSLLRPERGVVMLAVWLMLLDAALALAAPWPLMLVVDHGLSRHPYPAWLAGLSGLSPVQLAVAAATAGLILLAASATAGYLVTVLMGTVASGWPRGCGRDWSVTCSGQPRTGWPPTR